MRAMGYLWAVIVIQAAVSVQCFLHRYPRLQLGPRDDGYPGTPLFLTPYIESGNIYKAKRLARVPLTEEFRIKSFAGFFTVNKTYDSNQFFWYFPAIDKNSKEAPDAPVIVWLQGGPGESSLFGLFIENGPLYVINGEFKQRMYNWALSHHIIYIDNPVGAGFSFTNDSRGYCTDETQVGEQLYSTITQFFQLFPELQQNKFFVTGESYGGKFVTALAYTIHKKNPTAEVKINLKGIAIGNGWIDPEHQLLHSNHLYQIGLIDWNQERETEENEKKIREYIRNAQWANATEKFLDYLNLLFKHAGFDELYNLVHTENYFKYGNIAPILQNSSVRQALHVGNLTFHEFEVPHDVVCKYLSHEFMQSVAPWISELLDHYKVLIYNGQLDIKIAYPLTVNYLRNLKFSGSEEYKTAKRHIWKVGGAVAGYTKRAGNLLEVMVRNAGHVVPADQPEWALDMITRFTYNLPIQQSITAPGDGDPGKPLFLTPYIESGKISEAKRLARVPLTEDFRIKSFAGFFTVNKTYDSNHFFWYFPAIDKNSTDAPVIVWLQGGPGDSSLFGLFIENGPIYAINGEFQLRTYNWALNHHIIYIDNPVGTGFSFTNDSRGYCTDETQVGEQLYSTITQFFQLFPELQQNKFFVTGESYGGKFATALAYTIHKKNSKAEVKINLKGIAIGDGWIDPEHQLSHSKYLYQIGLIDWNQEKETTENENKIREYIRKAQWTNATEKFLDHLNVLFEHVGFDEFNNFLHTKNYFQYENISPILQNSFVRHALHVGNLTFHEFKTPHDVVCKYLSHEYMQSVAPWISELLDHYKVLIYNGQMDIKIPYPLTVNYIRNLKFAGSEEYKTAEAHAWKVGGELAGYTKQAGNLLEVMVRNAGRGVPADQPEWALDMITSFTYNLPMQHNISAATNVSIKPSNRYKCYNLIR